MSKQEAINVVQAAAEYLDLIDHPGTTFFVNENGWIYVKWSSGRHQIAGQDYWASAINHGIIPPRPGEIGSEPDGTAPNGDKGAEGA